MHWRNVVKYETVFLNEFGSAVSAASNPYLWLSSSFRLPWRSFYPKCFLSRESIVHIH
jgi:hypothetical protein